MFNFNLQLQKYKKLLIFLIKQFVHSLNNSKYGRSLSEYIFNSIREEVKNIQHNGHNFTFSTPNQLCHFRRNTFSTKEPETLCWIDTFGENTILWDIGANIGLYSIYAAKVKNSSVYSFEPSVFNIEVLARNIYLNSLTSNITIVPMPLNDKMGISNLQLTTTELGGALSTFEHKIGFDGKNINDVFETSLVGITLDFAHSSLGIPLPDYIKIDVDGIEHFILQGGDFVLKHVKSILIEINDDFVEQSSICVDILKRQGFNLQSKNVSSLFSDDDSPFKHSCNQIWSR